MEENNDMLRFENENNLSLNYSNDYISTGSEILNLTNDISNRSFQLLESENCLEVKSNSPDNSDISLKNTQYQHDPNFNISDGCKDVSLSEQFAKMKLTSTNDSQLEGTSSFTDPSDSFVNALSLPEVKDSSLQDTYSANLLQDCLSALDEHTSPKQNVSGFVLSGETLCSEELNQNQSSHPLDIPDQIIVDEMKAPEGNALKLKVSSPSNNAVFSPKLEDLPPQDGHDSLGETLLTPNKIELPLQITPRSSLADETMSAEAVVSPVTSSENGLGEGSILGEVKAMTPGDVSGHDLSGTMHSSDEVKEVSGDLSLSANETRIDTSVKTLMEEDLISSADCAVNQNLTLFGDQPCNSVETADGDFNVPNSVQFTNLSAIDSPGDIEDHIFKVPALPKEEEEEFTDAVQFFKDPHSFQFLENIRTSVPPECVIPRSSLYVAFDPLHSKIGSQQQQAPGCPSNSDPVSGLVAQKETPENTLPLNRNLSNLPARESMGNVLISFDSPTIGRRAGSELVEKDLPVPSTVPKQLTEEQHQKALKIHQLMLQDEHYKQHRELESKMKMIQEKKDAEIEKLSILLRTQHCMLEELGTMVIDLFHSKNKMHSKMEDLEKENIKLKEDLEVSGKDLQSVESTFADFHKRYEQCKGMLKTYKDNETLLKEDVTNWKTKVSEQEQKYIALQERTQEILDKGNAEVAGVKKSSEAQVAVLKAQLKKVELKNSSLESDLKQIKIENSKLSGICDDLMAKVSES